MGLIDRLFRKPKPKEPEKQPEESPLPDSLHINEQINGSTPLLDAIKAGNAGRVEALLRQGADPNLEARDGYRKSVPLHAAASVGNLQIVKLLTHYGMGNIPPDRYKEAINIAMLKGHFQVIQFLKAQQSSPPGPTSTPKKSPLTRQEMDLLWMDRTALGVLKASLDNPSVAVAGSVKDATGQQIEWAERVMGIAEQAAAASNRSDYTRAIEFYQQALEQAPECDLYLMSIGACLASMGKPREGLPYLERAATVSPSNARIQRNLTAIRQMLTADVSSIKLLGPDGKPISPSK